MSDINKNLVIPASKNSAHLLVCNVLDLKPESLKKAVANAITLDKAKLFNDTSYDNEDSFTLTQKQDVLIEALGGKSFSWYKDQGYPKLRKFLNEKNLKKLDHNKFSFINRPTIQAQSSIQKKLFSLPADQLMELKVLDSNIHSAYTLNQLIGSRFFPKSYLLENPMYELSLPDEHTDIYLYMQKIDQIEHIRDNSLNTTTKLCLFISKLLYCLDKYPTKEINLFDEITNIIDIKKYYYLQIKQYFGCNSEYELFKNKDHHTPLFAYDNYCWISTLNKLDYVLDAWEEENTEFINKLPQGNDRIAILNIFKNIVTSIYNDIKDNYCVSFELYNDNLIFCWNNQLEYSFIIKNQNPNSIPLLSSIECIDKIAMKPFFVKEEQNFNIWKYLQPSKSAITKEEYQTFFQSDEEAHPEKYYDTQLKREKDLYIKNKGYSPLSLPKDWNNTLPNEGIEESTINNILFKKCILGEKTLWVSDLITQTDFKAYSSKENITPNAIYSYNTNYYVDLPWSEVLNYIKWFEEQAKFKFMIRLLEPYEILRLRAREQDVITKDTIRSSNHLTFHTSYEFWEWCNHKSLTNLSTHKDIMIGENSYMHYYAEYMTSRDLKNSDQYINEKKTIYTGFRLCFEQNHS